MGNPEPLCVGRGPGWANANERKPENLSRCDPTTEWHCRLHPRGARPAPAWITYSSLLGQHQRRERARPLRWSFHSMLVQQPRHVAANRPYMAPYCPPMLPLQCLRPSVEEGRIGEAWAEPVLPAPEPVVATTGAESLASPVTRPGRLARDQSNWMEPASMQATGVADVSAGPRPMHRHRPTSSSSTPSSTDTEDAAPQSTPPVANLHVHSQEETSRSDPCRTGASEPTWWDGHATPGWQ